ncbi:MAG: hypothetical protein QMD92_07020, partial [bacterium]|nr:hypothetical protein [bacterium]
YRLRDNVGNIGTYTDTIKLDTIVPTFTDLNATPNPAKAGGVTITFTVSESLQANPTVTVNGNATTYVSKSGLTYTYTYNVAASGEAQGATTVAITGTDLAGNVGGPYSSSSFVIDTVNPSALSVVINDTNGYTASTSINLTLSASDGSGSGIDKMCFSNDGTTYSSWEDYGTAKTWTIATGDGNKIVYFKVKDKAGNEASAVTDSTTLDQTPPSGTINIAGGAEYTTSATVTLNLSGYTDGSGSGLDKVCYSNDGSSFSAWEDAAATKTNFNLTSGDGTKTVYYRLRDNVGNIGTYTDTIKLYTNKPAGKLTCNKTENIRKDDKITFTAHLDAKDYIVEAQYDSLLETPEGYKAMTDEGNNDYTIIIKVTNKNNNDNAPIYIKATDKAGNIFTTSTIVKLNNATPPIQDDEGNEGVSINPKPVPVVVSKMKIIQEVYVPTVKVSGRVEGAKLILIRGEVENSPLIIPRNGKFSKQVPLVVGKNEIAVIVRDTADNEFTKTVYITYVIPKVTEEVGREGKEVKAPDKTKVEIPEGALIGKEKISIKPANKDEQTKPYETQQSIKLLGTPHEFGPVNIVFHRPVKITLSYLDSDWDVNGNDIRDTYPDGSKPDELDESKFEIVFWDGTEWVKAGKSIVDTENNTVSVWVNHFTIYDIGESQGTQSIPEKFNLYLTKNPFRVGSNEEPTRFTYDLPKDATITIKIFNLAGDLVRNLSDNETKNAGSYSSPAWNGLNDFNDYVGSGIYVYYFKAEYTDGTKDIITKPIGVIK